jgi:PKD repeat protein
VSHTFAAGSAYTVTLVVDDLYGTGSQSQTVTIAGVNAPPVASFTFSCSDLECSFNASASSDPDGTIRSYAFNFGDGTTWIGGWGPFHRYAADGSYTVTLTVTDNGNLTAQTAHVVTAALNKWPVASFTSACTGFTCTFNASGSSDPDGTIRSYGWTFGDGATGAGVTASHTYAAGGSYTVTLTVTDNGGATSTQAHSVTVLPPDMHVGDLDGASTTQQNAWTATVTVTIHTSSHSLLATAVVSGTWNDGSSGSCTTNATGWCAVSKAGIPKKTGSVTFTITNVARATFVYEPAANHDPDGDSNGSTVGVIRQ